VANNESEDQAKSGGDVPPPAAVSFVTTEHFTLQGARSSTIAEATGRASMFLGAVSGGLVGLGLGATFYAFGLILLPTLAFVGLVTFSRALQSGIEDYNYAHPIARLRGYYFQYAPDMVDYLVSVPPEQRLTMQGLRGGPWQKFVTVAGMVSVVTAVLAGSAAGLFATVLFRQLVIAALAGVLVAVGVLVGMISIQTAAWHRVRKASLYADEQIS
jgi:hypothetical protein